VQRLRDRLLGAFALSLAGCAASSAQDDVVIPTGSAPSVSTAGPATSALELPSKNPEEVAWFEGNSLCMPASDSDQTSLVGYQSCGVQPGTWARRSDKFACYGCSYHFSEEVSRAQSRKRPGSCCYDQQHHYKRGRPLEGPSGDVLAGEGRGDGWTTNDFDDLPRAAEAARAWELAAREEHASVAAFARLALSLQALGADADLVRRAHEAALDETRHARLSYAIASRLAGERVAPGALRVRDAGPIETDRVALFRETARGGCVGETIAAVEARAAAALAVRSLGEVLEGIAADEERHAELAARVLGWLLRTASPDERARMRAVARELGELPLVIADGPSAPAVGVLGRRDRERIASEVLAAVALPLLAHVEAA